MYILRQSIFKEDFLLVRLDQVYFSYSNFFPSKIGSLYLLKYCELWFQLITFKVSHSRPYIIVKTQLLWMLSARGRSQNLDQLGINCCFHGISLDHTGTLKLSSALREINCEPQMLDTYVIFSTVVPRL